MLNQLISINNKKHQFKPMWLITCFAIFLLLAMNHGNNSNGKYL